MEVAILLISLVGLAIPASLVFWAMWRSTSLTRRLHPLTPEQRRRKRKAYAVMTPIMVASVALGAVLESGGTGAIVALSIFAFVLLADAVLTPWLHYRRIRRKSTSSEPRR